MPEVRVPHGLAGEDAIQALGEHLPAVAAHHRQSVEELRATLRRDHALRLDGRGRLFYVCEGLAVPPNAASDTNSTPPVAQIFPLSQTFLLHSKPGANRVIYLDFDGHTLADNAWVDNNNGGASIVAPPWDTDGNPASFSSAEQTLIQQVWFRVAEDYAPFDVDVTTEYPGEAAMTYSGSGDTAFGTRALVSPIGDYFGNPGGIAYVGVYDASDYYKPALVFPENLGNNEKNIAEAISHEVGHNLGLSHDGTTTGSEYYGGQGNWGPIMGVAYSRPISQWSKGEYANANNTQDDLAVITSNGLGYRADEFGGSQGAATPLAGVSISTNGVVGRPSDLDFFSFQAGTGTAQFGIVRWERGGNLHMLVSLYDEAGVLVTNVAAVDDSGGAHSVNFSAFLSSGLYYLAVEGVGNGNPLTTGYTDYGSLGQFTLTITLPAAGSWLPTATGNYSWTNTANWASGNVPGAPDTTAFLTNAITGNQTIALDSAVTVGRLHLGRSGSANAFLIQSGAGGPLTFSVGSGNATLLKFGNGADEIAAGVSLADPLLVSNGLPATLRLSGPISGTGSLTKTGSGRLLLGGTHTFSGNLVVSNGTVALTPAALLATPRIEVGSGAVFEATNGYSVVSGQNLAGRGSVAGDVTLGVNTILAPGGAGGAGTLTLSNQLTLGGGATWTIDLATNSTPGGGTNDLVAVLGDLSLAGLNTIQVNLLEGALESPGAYTIATYGGSLSGSAANLTVTNATRYVLTPDTSTPGAVQLNVSGNPANLTWRGDGAGNVWNLAGSSNWFNGVGADRFFQLDSVLFNDSGSNNTPVSLSGSLTPALLTVDAAKNYTFAGTGKLSGNTILSKQGAGTLTISNANDFIGGITVSAGQLKPANTNALGSVSGATYVTNTGALELNGLNMGAEPVVVSGAGAGSGAILNSGASQQNALRFVTLSGDATFGGTARWDVRANPTAALAGNGHKLIKTGANEVWLAGLGETGLGDIEVRQGLLGLADSTTAGDPASALSVWTGATLHLSSSDTFELDKRLRVTNATVRSDAGNNTSVGPAIFSGAVSLPIGATLELGGPIAGSGSITKSGAGTLILSGSNAYTGALYVDTASDTANAGNVRISGGAALRNAASPIYIRNMNSGTSTLQLDSGITVTQAVQLSGRNNSVPALQNVSGSNMLSGGFSLQVGGANYWFQSDSGMLTLDGPIPTSTPGGTRRLTFLGAGSHQVSGVLQNGTGGGSLALTKTGSGSLTIKNTNSYSGGTVLSQGILYVQSSRAFGTGTVTTDTGDNQGRIALSSGVTVTNAIVANTVNAGVGLGLLTVSGNVGATFSGPITFNASASAGGHIAGPSSGGPLQFTGPITMPDGTFMVIRTGNVRFSGGGDYPEIQVRASTTSLGANNGLCPNALLDIGGNGSPQSPTYFNLNGFNQTLAGLKNAVTPANVAWVTNSAATTNTLTLAPGTGSNSFGGSIVGRVALTIESGTQTLAKSGTAALNGLYTYSGPTLVNGGRLLLGAGMALPNTPLISVATGATLDATASPLTVGAAQVLGGSGTVQGRVTVLGTIAPGDGPGLLTCGSNLTFGATGRVQWELAGNSTNGADRVLAGSALNVTNGAAIDLVLNRPGSTVNFLTSFWRTNRTWPVITSSGMSGSFNVGTVSSDAGGRPAATYGAFTLQQGAGGVNLVWTPIPGFPVIDEPTVVFTQPATNPVGVPDLLSDLNVTVAVTGVSNVNSGVTWSQVSGPASAGFAYATGTNNRVGFTVAGDYVLRCAATNEVGNAHADLTVRVAPSADTFTLRQGLNGYLHQATFIREDNTNWNSGARDQLIVGSLSSKRLRPVLSFGLDSVPWGSVIESATVDLWTDAQAGTGSVGALQLHRLTNDFVEGIGDGLNATNGAGTGATWISRTGGTNTTDLWNKAGGDFDTNAVLSSLAGYVATNTGVQRTFVSTPALVAALASAITSNRPLGLVVWSPATEAAGGSAYSRLSSNDSTNDLRRPQLTLALQLNAAPGVNTGVAPAATNLLAAPLNGSVSRSTSSLWSLVSGPGLAAFGNENAPATTVVFSDPGNYVLRLTASNAVAQTSADLAVSVVPLPPPQISAVTVTNGQFQLRVNGVGGWSHTILASTNLLTWDSLFTTNPAAMPFLWTDTNSNLFPQRFYRVLAGP
jgi:autotransporter-associated beta strand protein